MKKLQVIIMVFITLLTISVLTNSVNATDTMELNIDSMRPFSDDNYDGTSGNDTYKILQNSLKNTIFKIGERQNTSDEELNFSKLLYCLRFGLGFGEGTREISSTDTSYNKLGNLKDDKQTIIDYYSNTPTINFNINESFEYQESGKTYTFTPYNAILWLADNICDPNPNNLDSAKSVAKLLGAAEIENNLLTMDDIDVIQQCALWHFSNYNEFMANNEYLANVLKINDEDFPTDTDRYRQAETLYKYLINTAKKEASIYETTIEPIHAPTIELDNTLTSSVTEENFTIGGEETSYYVVGPFRLDITNEENWDIETKCKLQYKSSISETNYIEISNARFIHYVDGIVDSFNYDITEGGEFYVAINKININGNIVEFKLTVEYTYSRQSKVASVWVASENDQPVLLLENENNEATGDTSIIVDNRKIDFALRKYISSVKRNDEEILTELREPVIDTTSLQSGTTATYKHLKKPVEVKTGDIITYKIALYNEGSIDGKVSEIIDYLPKGIVFDPDLNPDFIASKDLGENPDTNYKYSYQIIDNKIIICFLEDYTLTAFTGEDLSSKTIDIVCRVDALQTSKDQILTNIAEISEYEIAEDENVKDRDSTPENIKIPAEISNYWGKEGQTATKPGATNPASYYEGQEDDDDFEKVVIKGVNFDLSLRKYISSIKRNGEEILTESREPVIDTTTLQFSTTAEYTHPKDAVTVKKGDIITYTIRVYNEGEVAGYVNKITDHIPEGLEFIIDSEINTNYMWQYESAENIDLINTTYWSKERTDNNNVEGLLEAYDGTELDYVDVQIEFEVIAENTFEGEIVNIAEISESVAVNENNEQLSVTDRDSTQPVNLEDYDLKPAPENSTYQEDDDDYERVQLKYFDLSLRKFITAVDDEQITGRIPEVSYENSELIYNHPKEPIYVNHGSIVEYTIRVYNEGKIAGYAEIVSDDIPAGLVYLPNNQTNIDYGWEMYTVNLEGELELTDDPTQAIIIKTTYLSEENGETMMEEGSTQNPNLINPFNPEAEISDVDPLNPDYRNVKVVFQVDESQIPAENEDRIIINHAQISEDSDDDEDSEPDVWEEGEDDQDTEAVHVREFDLSLLKWVSKTILTVDGQTTTTETGFMPNTGHTEQIGDNIRPNTENEPIAQVVIDKKKINSTEVKFVYLIKVINEGDLPGYATEITDYIPEGLKFVEEDNPIWTKVGEDKITTNVLEEVLLNPGDSRTLEVVFTWINDGDNLGVKKNIAAITEDYNEYADAPDVDSAPEDINIQEYETEQEDDDDYALVILTLKTGSDVSYITLVLVVLLIITTGIICIKRYVL